MSGSFAKVRHGSVAGASACAALSALSVPAISHADQGLIPYVTAIPREGELDTVTFAAFQVERYDSNFFRLPDGVDPNLSSRRSGISSTSGVGLNLERSYGLQKITVNAAVTRAVYSQQGNLDETSGRFDSKLDWSITPQLTGNLVFDYLRQPTDYEYSSNIQQTNPQTTRTLKLDVDYRPGAALHPRLSIFQTENRLQDATFQVENSRTNAVGVALVYDFASTNVLSLYANRGRGRNLDTESQDPSLQVGPAFQQTEFGAQLDVKSYDRFKLNGFIARLIRDGQSFSSRNFNGIQGELTGTYSLTGKTALELFGGRRLYVSQDLFGSYFVEADASAALIWQATGKIKVRPKYTYRRQEYRDSPFAVPVQRLENTHYATLEVDWTASRAVDFAASISRSRRTASDPTLPFADSNASVFARVKF